MLRAALISPWARLCGRRWGGGMVKDLDSNSDGAQPSTPPAGDADDALEQEIINTIWHHRRKVWLFGGITLSLGLCAIVASHAALITEADHDVREIVRDLGIALIVSALVGIFYDFFNAQAGITAEKFRMEQNTKRLIATGREVRHLLDEYAIDRRSVNLIRRWLVRLLNPQLHAQTIDGLERVLTEIHAINLLKHKLDDKNHQPCKEPEEYIRWLSWIITSYVVPAAVATRSILEGLIDGNDDIAVSVPDYFPPERRDITLQLLAAQMRAMSAGDAYDAISNVWLYASIKDGFHASTHDALGRGLKIRRIYNLCYRSDDMRNEIDFHAAVELAVRQARQFHEKNFEVRYLTNEIVNRLDIRKLNSLGIDDRDSLRSMYVGHYYQVKNGKMLRFAPRLANMSGIGVKVYSTTSEVGDCDGCGQLFEFIWQQCTGEPPAQHTRGPDRS